MSKADRLLLILNLIRSRKNLRPKDLAQECGVSERTIYRDINSISSANIPIYYNKGYKFLSGAFLPPLNLSLNEYIVLCLALNYETINSIPALKTTVRKIMAKIDCSLPENVRNDYLKIKKEIDDRLKQKDQRPINSLITELLKLGSLQKSIIDENNC